MVMNSTLHRFGRLVFLFIPVLAGTLRADDRLTLQQAIAQALDHNRTVQAAAAEVTRAGYQYRAAATQRLPQFSVLANGGELVTRPGLSFPAGSLGRLSDGSLLPATDTRIEAARRPAAFLFAQVNQPLTQQHRIGLQLAGIATEKAIAAERRRESEQDIVNQVRRVYYSIVSAESRLASAQENVRLYRELDRVTGERLLQQVSLKADALDMRGQLAEAEYNALVLRDQIADSKEQLNILMGRTADTPFEVSALEEISDMPLDVKSAQRQALENRPEIRQAALEVRRANLSRRAKLAEYIPDLSVNISYLSFFNVNSTFTSNIASAGLQVQWEPFDWGRKRREAAAIAEQGTEAKLRESEMRANVMAQIDAAWRRVREARALLAVARTKQESAREAMRETQIQFEQQAALLQNVRQRQASKARADESVESALAQFWSARADLDKAIGSEGGTNE
jgi:outer membrane protein